MINMFSAAQNFSSPAPSTFAFTASYGDPGQVLLSQAHRDTSNQVFPPQSVLQGMSTLQKTSARRHLLLTPGSIRNVVVVVSDINNNTMGVLNGRQHSLARDTVANLKNNQRIGNILVRDLERGDETIVDLRQAQNWLNTVQTLGLTVGRNASGKLLAGVTNLDFNDVHPDRSMTTFGTKCMYEIGASREGSINCDTGISRSS